MIPKYVSKIFFQKLIPKTNSKKGLANIACITNLVPNTDSKNCLETFLANIAWKYFLQTLLAMKKLPSKIAANYLQMLQNITHSQSWTF